MKIKTINSIIGINTETLEETTYILPNTILEVIMLLGENPNKYYMCESTLYPNVFIPIFKSQCTIIKKKENDILSDEENFLIE